MKKKTSQYFVATYNVLLFLIHFFSVKHLLKSLFDPWRHIEENVPKNSSLQAFIDTAFFNLISRTIGFAMRASLLIVFFVVTTLYILLLPAISLLFFLILPLLQLESRIPPSDEDLKKSFYDTFMKRHANTTNQTEVEAWFAYYYDHFLTKQPWWHLSRLMSITPLAHDWSAGYTNHLDNYGEDLHLTQKNFQIVGRETELKEIASVMSREKGGNVLLIGEEGMGRQAIVHELAHRSQTGMLVPNLNYLRFVNLNIEKILAAFVDSSQREVFFEELLREAAAAGNVVVLIESLHYYTDPNNPQKNLTIPFQKITQSEHLHVLATTTPHSYETYVRPATGLDAIFTKLKIPELTEHEVRSVLAQRALDLEKKYGIVIPYELLGGIIKKSEYYLSSQPFPTRALNLMQDAFVQAADQKAKTLETTHLDKAITMRTHAPTSMDADLKNKLLNLEQTLKTHIKGQDRALVQLAASLRRAFVMLGKRKKPLATLLFTGPTGTGKTQTAKLLTETIFDTSADRSKRLLRFDMSLYQRIEDIPHLIGSSDGKEPGLLTEQVEEYPYATLLLDEIEKAHHDLLNIFLTIFDEGYYSSGVGKRIDCKHLIVIATTNALKVEESFSPEFLNRFDGIVHFDTLDETEILDVAKTIAQDLKLQYSQTHDIELEISDETLKTVVQSSYDSKYGARDIRRAMGVHVEDRIAKKILENAIKPGEKVVI